MTEQEAIKWIDGRVIELSCLVDITSTDKGMQRINEEYNALLVARAAIFKRIPETVTHEATLRKSCTCPACLNVVDEFTEFVPGQRIRVQVQWCRYCGQALKWEEE